MGLYMHSTMAANPAPSRFKDLKNRESATDRWQENSYNCGFVEVQGNGPDGFSRSLKKNDGNCPQQGAGQGKNFSNQVSRHNGSSYSKNRLFIGNKRLRLDFRER